MNVAFGPDKSMMLRGVAIVFMILLHNGMLPEFKICVPIFTFLVGYGYAFAKQRNFVHAFKRIWHLLSHFWLILLGICLPVGIIAGHYKATIYSVFLEMFGLESQLNWYSWYVYFYIFAMFFMIPASRIILRYKRWGVIGLVVFSFCLSGIMHLIPNWSQNVWLQAAFDCGIVAPTMFSGYYLAVNGTITNIKIRQNVITAGVSILVMAEIFFMREFPYVKFLDFILVPIFVGSLVILFNIIKSKIFISCLQSLGKESMNMWFLHALFATTCTAVVFAPLIDWINIKWLLIVTMIAVSYFMSKIVDAVYNCLAK